MTALPAMSADPAPVNGWRARLDLLDASVLGPLRQAPGRALLAVIAIALGVGLGFSVYLINRVAADEVQGASRSLFGLADLAVQAPAGGFDETLFPVIARLPRVAVASPVVELQVRLPGRDRNLKLIGIDEMRHAEMFAERIKELGGEPTATPDGEVKKRQDVRAVFPFDTNLEDDTVDAYNRFLLICRENGDNISANLLETIIVEEQAHLNYFDNVASHIKNLGDSYLSKIAGTPAETGGTTKGFVIGPVTPDATA